MAIQQHPHTEHLGQFRCSFAAKQRRERGRWSAAWRLWRVSHAGATPTAGHLPGTAGNRHVQQLRADTLLHPGYGFGGRGVEVGKDSNISFPSEKLRTSLARRRSLLSRISLGVDIGRPKWFLLDFCAFPAILPAILEGRRIAPGASRGRKVRTPKGAMPRNPWPLVFDRGNSGSGIHAGGDAARRPDG